MKVIINERAVYLIFPNDRANIVHSTDELASLARGVEDTEIWRPIAEAMLALEAKTKGAKPRPERMKL